MYGDRLVSVWYGLWSPKKEPLTVEAEKAAAHGGRKRRCWLEGAPKNRTRGGEQREMRLHFIMTKNDVYENPRSFVRDI